MNRATFQSGAMNYTLEELGWHDLNENERRTFGIPEVLPIPGLMTGNADLVVEPWSGKREPELAPSLCYPSPLQANVPAYGECVPMLEREPRRGGEL